MDLTGVDTVMHEVHRVEGQGPVPEVVEGVRDAGLLDGDSVLQPDEAQQVERSGVGDTLELRHGLLSGHREVVGRDDDLRRDVHVERGVHLQLYVLAVLLLAQLGVGSPRPAITIGSEINGVQNLKKFAYLLSLEI